MVGKVLFVIGCAIAGVLSAVVGIHIMSERIGKLIGEVDALTEQDIRQILEEAGEKLPEEDTFTVVVMEDVAYWLEGNALMCAPTADDEVDFDHAMRYNAIEAPKEELRKILSVIDTIKENT